jgi:outer membrane lipoprotein SlyB
MAVILSMTLTACYKELPPGEYDANEVGKIKKVVPGVILSKRAVKLQQHNEAGNTSKNALIDTNYTQTHGVEYVIKLGSGSIISLVQNEDLKLKNKQKILVIYGRNTRVVPDNGSDNF